MAKPIKNIRECYLCHGEGDKNIGILEAEISLDTMDEKVGEARRLSNLSAITISLILSAFIFLLLFWLVIKPISKLNRKMALAENGDLTVRSGLLKGDELGKLGRSFDSMIEKLQDARTQLEKYHYQQLIRADRLASVGELASGIAHEIKNPLAGIAGAVQIFARDFKGDEKKSLILKEILQQIARLDKSVKDLLNYASPSMSELAMGDLNQIVEKALFFVIQQPNAKEIKFVKELDASLPKILVDDKQIQQVLLNLFLNGLNAMSGEGILRIRTLIDVNNAESVAVEVEDNGVGISEADMSKLFVPFYTSRDEGTGLGLPITKRIVEQHGGNISINSVLGKGTCIKITLPIKGTHKEPRIQDEKI
jgi:signal transduction histidine kinase